MKILLINTNPVVSRLLALCTRDEHMALDEVKSVEGVKKMEYDILFVDEASYASNQSALFEALHIRKKVFLSYVEDTTRGFDITVRKPFLPSQIIKIIAETDSSEMSEGAVEESIVEKNISTFLLSVEKSFEEKEVHNYLESQERPSTRVLNADEIEKIKALLDMGDNEIEINEDEFFDNDVYEARKIKVIKEQLIAEGLEILEEDEMLEELSASVEKVSEDINKKLKKIKKRHKKNTGLGEEERFNLEEALSTVIANLNPKKIKKLLNGEEIKIKIKLEDHQ